MLRRYPYLLSLFVITLTAAATVGVYYKGWQYPWVFVVQQPLWLALALMPAVRWRRWAVVACVLCIVFAGGLAALVLLGHLPTGISQRKWVYTGMFASHCMLWGAWMLRLKAEEDTNEEGVQLFAVFVAVLPTLLFWGNSWLYFDF